MSAHLTPDGYVLVPDQATANRLYNRGGAGTPQKGGALRLTLIEALRLVEDDRLAVYRDADMTGRPLGFRDLFEIGLADGTAFEIPLFAYRDLKGRGRVVKHANKRALDFLVYAEGKTPPKDEPRWLAWAVSERTPLGARHIRTALAEADAEGATLLILVVDEEGDLTHYEVERIDLAGRAPPLAELGPYPASFVQDRVVVWDEDAARALRDPHFLGKPVPGGLQLSLVEATALEEAGVIQCPGLHEAAAEVQEDLDLRTTVYRALRDAGLWAKTGFKFGTHFRAYEHHPDESHAPWLVHAVPMDWSTTWPEVSRAVRLAHGVRKTMVFALVEDDAVRFVSMRRVRP